MGGVERLSMRRARFVVLAVLVAAVTVRVVSGGTSAAPPLDGQAAGLQRSLPRPTAPPRPSPTVAPTPTRTPRPTSMPQPTLPPSRPAPAAVTGVSMALIFTAGMTHLVRSSSAEERGRTVGRAMAGWGLGALLAPSAAGALASAFGWRAAFLLAAGLSVAAVPLGLSIRGALPRPPEPSPTGPQRRWALGMTRLLIPVVVVSALVWGSGSAIMRVVLPLYGSEGAQLSPALIGVWLSLFAAVTFGIMLVSGTILDRLGRLTVLLLAAIPGVVGGLILLLPTGLVPFALLRPDEGRHRLLACP